MTCTPTNTHSIATGNHFQLLNVHEISLPNHQIIYSKVGIENTKRCLEDIGQSATKTSNFIQTWSGWWLATPLKNMNSSVGITIPNIWKNKCSKPPTNGVRVNNNPAPSGCAVALPEPAHVAPRSSSLPGGCPRGWP